MVLFCYCIPNSLFFDFLGFLSFIRGWIQLRWDNSWFSREREGKEGRGYERQGGDGGLFTGWIYMKRMVDAMLCYAVALCCVCAGDEMLWFIPPLHISLSAAAALGFLPPRIRPSCFSLQSSSFSFFPSCLLPSPFPLFFVWALHKDPPCAILLRPYTTIPCHI